MKVFGTDYDTRDGSCVRDYVHVEDLAEAHYLGLRYIMEHGESQRFNLGSSEGFTVLELIREAERVTGERVPRELSARRPGDPATLVASNGKARQAERSRNDPAGRVELGAEPEVLAWRVACGDGQPLLLSTDTHREYEEFVAWRRLSWESWER